MEKRTAQNCRWAEPTLFLATPEWLEAWNMPWACHRDGTRLLESTEECAGCPRWEARRAEETAAGFAPSSTPERPTEDDVKG